MAGKRQRQYRPRDIVWFSDNQGNEHRATVISKPFAFEGLMQIEVIFIHPIKGEVATVVPVSDLSEPVGVLEPTVKVPTRKEKIIKTLKEIKVKLTKPAIIAGIIAFFVILIAVSFPNNYNDLVKGRNAVSNSRAQIDTRLEERYEVIDNIVASVEGSQAQESDVFGKIAAARKLGGSATTTEGKAEANAQIDTQIAMLPRLQEAYPELRSNDQISKLIADVQGKALGIREARDSYNTVVTNYNNNIASFPKNIYAGIFGFKSEELFKGSSEAKVNPKVEINRENK